MSVHNRLVSESLLSLHQEALCFELVCFLGSVICLGDSEWRCFLSMPICFLLHLHKSTRLQPLAAFSSGFHPCCEVLAIRLVLQDLLLCSIRFGFSLRYLIRLLIAVKCSSCLHTLIRLCAGLASTREEDMPKKEKKLQVGATEGVDLGSINPKS